MEKNYKESIDPNEYAIPEDYANNRHKLEWPDRGSYFIEQMVTDVVINEAGSGIITALAKRSISDLYTESGVERFKTEIQSHPSNIQDTIETLSDQIVEALNTTDDYGLIRKVFYDTLNTHYITKVISKDERLENDQAFELGLRYYSLVRCLRHIILKNETVIKRGINRDGKD